MTGEIIKALGKRQVLRNHTPVVANVTTMFDWEVDLFSVNKAGMTYEFEVKISRADFLRDKNKKKWAMYEWKKKTRLPNYMAYACPAGLIEAGEIPAFCGLYYYANGEVIDIKNPSLIHDVVKDFNEINFKIARMYSQRQFLGCTLISHLNKEARQRNEEREQQRVTNHENFMEWASQKRLLNSEQNPDRSVATEADSSTGAGNQIEFPNIPPRIIEGL